MEDSWKNILTANKIISIKSFQKKIDLTQEMIISNKGKPDLEQTLTILEYIERIDYDTALILPEGFLYPDIIDARTVRKNLPPLKLRRVETKQEAIAQESTPQKLIKEKIEQLKEEYKKNPDNLCKDYGGINYRGITDKKNKTYLFSDCVDGYLHSKNAEKLIQIKKYDSLEALLKSKDKKTLSFHEIAEIRRVLIQLRKRKMMVPEKAKQIILSGKAERVVKIPSTSELGKFYELKFRRLPVAFSEHDKNFYATWTDSWIEPSCHCGDKMWYIKYINVAGEITYCVHEIAAYRALINSDWKNKKPTSYPNPYIATSPFFKPSQNAIDFYIKLKNQVFATKESKHEHLTKPYTDIWLEKQVRRGRIELID